MGLAVVNASAPSNFEALKHTIAAGVKDIPTFEGQMAFFLHEFQQTLVQVESVKDMIEADLFPVLGFSDSKCIYYDPIIVTNSLRISIEDTRTPQDIHNLLLSSGKFGSLSLEAVTITFVHTPTATTCELVFRSGIDRSANLLVRYYMGLESKVQSLMMFVHFWAASYHLDALAVDFLVLFFLQQEPYKVPSVKDLQTDALPELIEGHNCGFKHLGYHSLALHTANILTLVKGFFDLYQKFDYSSYVISLYLGTPVHKLSLDKIPDVDAPMWLQHPFQHSHCIPVPVELLRDFVTLSNVGVDLVATGENELLYHLLNYNINLDDKWNFSISKDPNEDPLEWITCIKSVFYTVFSDVFGCEVSETAENAHKFVYYVSGSTSVFNNRVTVAKMLKLSPDVSELDKEIAVSRYILDNVQATKPSWWTAVRVDFLSDTSRVAVDFIRNCADNGLNVDYHLSVALRKFWALRQRIVKMEPEGEEESEVEIVGSLTDTDEGIFVQVPDAAAIPEKISALSAALLGHPCRNSTLQTVSNDLRTLLLASEISLATSPIPELDMPYSWYEFHIESKVVTLPTLLTLTKDALSQSQKFCEILIGSTSLMCRHVETQAMCCLVVRPQVKSLIAQHPMVIPLTTLVKFWVRRCGLVDFDGCCIYFLVMFYLQSEQANSLFGLLRGFFTFYGSFDYLSYLVSPRLGTRAVKSKSTAHGAGICIQDTPGILRCISLETSGKFAALCRSATEALTVDSNLSFVQHPYSHSFVEVRNEGKTDNNFRICVEMYTLHILRKVLGCQVKKSGIGRVKFDCLIEGSKVQVTLVFKQGGCRVNLSGEKASMHVLHVVYVKLGVLLKSEVFSMDEKLIKPQSEEMREIEPFSIKVTEILEGIPADAPLYTQVSSLLECLLVTPSDSELSENLIRDDLSSILDSNTIFFAPRLSKLEPLEIFIESSGTLLQEISFLLLQSTSFTDVSPATQTITCKHLETGATCQLQISGKFSRLKSEVMRKYSSLRGVRSLLVMGKFWADCHELCGVGGFSSEAVYMLVIFFLQQKLYQLPPVVVVQNLDRVFHEELENPQLLTLLCRFFEYYASFNYFSCVVSPVCGIPIMKVKFLEPYDLPDCFEAYTNQSEDLPLDSSMCIQDFFDHARNVAVVGCKLSGRFATLCHTSAQVLTSTQQLLPAFLKNQDNECTFRVDKKRNIPINIPAKIFRDVFNCTAKCTPSTNSLTYHCTGTNDIWNMRAVAEKSLTIVPPRGADREAAITARVVADYPKPSSWTIVIKFIFNPEDIQLEFSGSDLSGHFCHFVKVKQLWKFISRRVDVNELTTGFSSEVTSLLADEAAAINQESRLSRIRSDLPTKCRVYCPDPTGLPGDVHVRVQSTQQIQEILHMASCNFRDPTVLTAGQVRCFHHGTDLSVLLTSNEDYTTPLLEYYLSIDNKIHKTIATIKVWASRHQFNKHLYGSALPLMVIFFLQQEYKLPSVMDLQNDAPDNMVNGWNCAFAINRFGSPLHDTSILDMVHGFFKFYADFDCFSYVVAPYFGSAVAKTRFLEPFTLPEPYKAYCQKGQELSVDAGLCVQHPFEHNLNVSQEVSYDEAGRFACYCRNSAFLFGCPGPISVNSVLRSDLVAIRKSMFYLVRPEEEPPQEWRQYIEDLLRAFVIRVLGGRWNLNSKNTRFMCSGQHDVLVGRVLALKTALKDLSRNTNGFDKEVAVSRMMERTNWMWNFTFTVSMKKSKMVFHLEEAQKQQPYKLCHFIYTRLRKFATARDSIGMSVRAKGLKRKFESIVTPKGKTVLEIIPPQVTKSNRDSSVKPTGFSTGVAPEGASWKKHPSLPSTSKMGSVKPTAFITGIAPEGASRTKQPSLPSTSKMGHPPLVTTSFNDVTVFTKLLETGNSVDPLTYLVENFFAREKNLRARLTSLQHSLELLLSPPFPSFELHPVGSAVTGTFYSDSNFDFYVSLGNRPLLLLVKQIWRSKQFTKLKVNENVLTCIHKPTRSRCVLYIELKSHLDHTQLMEYYLSLDHKLRPLLCLLKLWLGFHELKQNPFCMTLRALELLLVFYLQQEPYKLPSAAHLHVPVIFDTSDLERATLLDLLFGFFEFYSKFDYYSYVISPFAGKAIDKTCFLPPIDLPDCFNQNLSQLLPVDSSVCVQDPFDLHVNITSAIDLRGLDSLSLVFRNAALAKGSSPYQLFTQCRVSPKFGSLVFPREGLLGLKEWVETAKKVLVMILTEMMFCTINIVKDKKIVIDDEKTIVVTIVAGIREYPCYNRPTILKECQKDMPAGATRLEKDVAVSNHLREASESSDIVGLTAVMRFMIDSGKLIIQVDRMRGTKHFLYTRMMMGLKAELSKREIEPRRSPPPAVFETVHLAQPYKVLVSVVGLSKDRTYPLYQQMTTFGRILETTHLGFGKKCAVEYTFADLNAYSAVVRTYHTHENRKVKIVPLGPMVHSTSEDLLLAATSTLSVSATFEEHVNSLCLYLNQMAGSRTYYKNIIVADIRAALYPTFQYNLVWYDFFFVDPPPYNAVEIYINNINTTHLPVIDQLIKLRSNFDMSVPNVFEVIQGRHVESGLVFLLKPGKTSNFEQLFRYYLSLDEKIPKFLATLEFWNKHNLVATYIGLNARLMHTLGLFYLQQQPFNLPPAYKLQDSNGYNFNLAFSITALKNASLQELITGFFKFFAKFDQEKSVVSLFSGLLIEKAQFSQPHALPPCYSSIKIPLNVAASPFVQDFFNPAVNLAVHVTKDNMANFVYMCMCACDDLESTEPLALYRLMNLAHRRLFENPTFFILNEGAMSEQDWRRSIKSNLKKFLFTKVMYHALETSLSDDRLLLVCDKIQEGTSKKKGLRINVTFLGNPSVVKIVFVRQNASPEVCLVCEAMYTQLETFLQKDGVISKIRISPPASTAAESSPPQPSEQPSPVSTAQRYDVSNLTHCRKTSERSNPPVTKPSPGQSEAKDDPQTFSSNLKISEPSSVVPTKTNSPPGNSKVKDDSNSTQFRKRSKTRELPKTNPPPDHTKDKPDPQVFLSPAKKDDDDDDVPSDFFDDFANDAFLEGLDIVDAWDENVEKDPDAASVKTVSEEESLTKKRSRRRRRSRSGSRDRGWRNREKRGRSRDSRGSKRLRWERKSPPSRRSPEVASRRSRRRSRSREPTPPSRRSFAVASHRSRRRSRSRESPSSARRSLEGVSTNKRDVASRPSNVTNFDLTKSRRHSRSRESSPRSRKSPERISTSNKSAAAGPTADLRSRRCSRSPNKVPNSSTAGTVIPPIIRPRPQVAPPQPVRFKLVPREKPRSIRTWESSSASKDTDAETVAPLAVTLKEYSMKLASCPAPPPPPVISVQPLPKLDPYILFEQKKMSLSEFLTINAKQEVTFTQEKVKVISRCQDVLGILNGKTSGKLVVRPFPMQAGQYQSPMKKKWVVRFHFTSASHQRTEGFSDCLNSILRRAGFEMMSAIEETAGFFK